MQGTLPAVVDAVPWRNWSAVFKVAGRGDVIALSAILRSNATKDPPRRKAALTWGRLFAALRVTDGIEAMVSSAILKSKATSRIRHNSISYGG